MSPYIIITDRLGLRRWTDTDVKPFSEINCDPEVMKFFPKILTGEETFEMIQRINQHFEKNGFGLFAVDKLESGEFIGFCGLYIPRFNEFFTPCIEIGWRFKKAEWGQGFATESAAACLSYGFESLKMDRIVSFTSPLNTRSEKLMQRIGMEYVADFDHPLIEKSSLLCRHVLYQKFASQR